MKLTVLTLNQSTPVNLNGLKSCNHMKNTVGKKIVTLTGIKGKFLIWIAC